MYVKADKTSMLNFGIIDTTIKIWLILAKSQNRPPPPPFNPLFNSCHGYIYQVFVTRMRPPNEAMQPVCVPRFTFIL